MPWKKNQPGCPCCSTVIGCTNCFNAESPAQYQVVISGVTNRDCVGCEVFNGTWILSASTILCKWIYDLSSAEFSGLQSKKTFPPCNSCSTAVAARVELTISFASTESNIFTVETLWRSSVAGCTANNFFRATLGSTVSWRCNNLTNHDIGQLNDIGFGAGLACLASTDHVLVTSL